MLRAPILTGAGLAPDDLLPERDRLLDPAFAADRGARPDLLGRPVARAELVRAKYRIGESLRAVWRLTDHAGHHHLVTMRAWARAGSEDPGEPGQVGWWLFPADRRLRQLDRVCRPDPVLARALGLPAWRASTVMTYAPERSLTVRAEAALGYVKTYAPEAIDTDRLADRYDLVAHWFLTRRPGARTPRSLAATGDLLAIEAMPGRTVASTRSATDPGVLDQLGRAIAHLHDLPVAATTGLVGPFARLRADRITRSAELVAQARPDVAGELALVADRLRDRPPAGELVLLHGDCHPGNCVVNEGGLALVDLDQAGLGDPACDIGSLLARLYHGVPPGKVSSATAAAGARAFLAAYRERRPLPDPASLRWHLAAALVAEQAIRAVNRLNPVGLRSLRATVARAGAVLDGGLLSDADLEGSP
jgi:aminoglycoside phosphotransferase (APT) family kinase protein